MFVEFNPLFPNLIKDIDPKYETRIYWGDVCTHTTIIKQIEAEAKSKGYDKSRGDKIVPMGPKLDQDKKGIYPVFRWVCKYKIQNPTENPGFAPRDNLSIDIKLEDYCEEKAKQENNGNIKPTHRDYKDPYSLYCVNPHAPT